MSEEKEALRQSGQVGQARGLPVREQYQNLEVPDYWKQEWEKMVRVLQEREENYRKQEEIFKEREESFRQRLSEMTEKSKEQERLTREDAESRILVLREEMKKVLKEEQQMRSDLLEDLVRQQHKTKLRATCGDGHIEEQFYLFFWDIRHWVLGNYSQSDIDVSPEVLRAFDPIVQGFFSTKIGPQWIRHLQEAPWILLWAFVTSQLYEKILSPALLCAVSADVAGLFAFVMPCSSKFPV